MSSHLTPAYLLARQQAYARLMAKHVHADPAWAVQVIKDNLARWGDNVDPHSMPYLQPWIDAANANNAEEIERMLLAEGERADVLRSCAPLAGLLPEAERMAFLDHFRETHGKP